MSRRNERGNASLVALVSVAALGLTGMFLVDTSSKITSQIKKAKLDNATLQSELTALNALSVLKSFLGDSPIKSRSGYAPSLYADDYFEVPWSLKSVESDVLASLVETKGSKVTLKTLAGGSEHFESIVGSFKSSDSPKNYTNSTLEIKAHNFDPTTSYVSSVDVEVSEMIGGTKKTTVGRIPLQLPRPLELKVLIQSPHGAGFTTDFGSPEKPLGPGQYRFQVQVSGIAHHAVLRVGPHTSILGLADGKIVHAARNAHARSAVMGTTDPIALGMDHTQNTTETRLEYNKSGTGNSCKIEIDRTSVATSLVPHTSVRISADVIGVDMKVVDSLSFDQVIYVSPGNTALANPTTPGELQCTEMCPTSFSEVFLGTTRTMPERLHFMQFWDRSLKGEKDFKRLDYFSESQTKAMHKLGVSGIICENLNVSASHFYAISGHTLPSRAALDTHNFNKWYADSKELGQFIAYVYPSCKRSFVGTRNGCGCFDAETKIQMADGTEKIVSDIRSGDRVWNPKSARTQTVKRVIAGPEKLPLSRIVVGGNVLKVTKEHPFLTPSGHRPTHDLKAGDLIFTEGRYQIVEERQEEIRPSGSADPIVWNFELEGGPEDDDHYVLANGIMTGDLLIQEKLKNKSDQ